MTCFFKYIYKGKVSVPHDQLISFMQTAHSLKIKGYITLFHREKFITLSFV